MLDLIFRNCRVIDGTGSPWFRADVGVRGGRIAGVGRLGRRKARREVDVRDKVICPGFVDIHSHSDLLLVIDPRAEAKVRQGVTTEIVGQCGDSASPLIGDAVADTQRSIRTFTDDMDVEWRTTREYLHRLEASGMSLNCAALVGHGNLRKGVMGDSSAAPSAAQLGAMKRWLRRSVREGAIGLSTGLVYPPSCHASTEEIVELCRVLAPLGGMYFTHMRGRSAQPLSAVDEVLEIARRTGARCHIAHVHGLMDDVRKIETGRARGLDVGFDQYPYTASSSGLTLLLPLWAKEGGREALVERLRRVDVRERLAREVRLKDPAVVLITRVRSEDNRWAEGLHLGQIAERLGKPPMEAICDLLVQEEGSVGMVRFGQSEEGVREVMKSPLATVGSDGSSYAADGPLRRGVPHPRSFGTFVRVLGHYARDEAVISLETAVRQMTSAPASRAGLSERGILRAGLAADLVVFDDRRVIDKATYQNPFQYPEGVIHVLVNGTFVLEDGARTDARPGRALRRRPDGTVR